MAWVKVDDSFYEHVKFLELDLAAMGLWLAGLAYCNRNLTDGVIRAGFVRRLCGDPAPLVAAGLWVEVDGGWTVHDYKDHQRSADEIKDLSTKRAAIGKQGGSKPKAKPKQPASKPQAEPQPQPDVQLNPPTPHEPDQVRWQRVMKAAVELSYSKAKDTKDPPRHPMAWKSWKSDQLREEQGERLGELLTTFARAPDGVLAAALLGDTHSLGQYRKAEAV